MVIAKDTVYILTVPSAMDRQVGVLPTPDAPLVKDLMLRLNSATEAVNKSPAIWSGLILLTHHRLMLVTSTTMSTRQTCKALNEPRILVVGQEFSTMSAWST